MKIKGTDILESPSWRLGTSLVLKHGIGLINSPATIDVDYRSKVRIILFNFSQDDFEIARGKRIAQLVIAR